MSKALAALVLAAGIVAQGPQPPTFRARADLVQVDVVVVDRNGDPVRGLKASDFTLFDRKQRQEIANFDEVSHARPVAVAGAAGPPPIVAHDVSSNQTVQAGRLVVLVIDDLHIYKERTARAREIATRVLNDLGHQSSMAVLFTSGEHSTQVVQDRARLAAAVATLKGRQSWRRPTPAIDKQRGDRIDAEMSAAQQLAIIQATQDTKVQAFFDNMTKYKTLQDAARLLGGGDTRRKAFVLISEGIGKNLTGLFGAMAPPGSAPQGGADYATSGNLPATMAETPYHDLALIDMMEALRRANVATYAIDPRGKVESKDLARECFPPPPGKDPCSEGLTDWHSILRQAQQGLEIVSRASGGFAITNTDDFASGLKRIVDDLDHYYLLGFYPADTKGKGYRPIDIRVPGHPDWTLRFRHGYMPGGPREETSANEMVALSAGVLPKTDLPLRLAAIALPGGGATARIVLVLEVTAAARQLEERDGRLRDTLKYEVLIVDEKKAKVRSVRGLEGRVTLSPNAAAGPAPDAASYQVTETIDVQPGRYEFRVSATSAKLGKGGSVYLGVDVPDFRSAPVVLGGLSIGYAEGARVAVAPPSPPPAVQRAARVVTPAPEVRPALPFPPTLDREFAPADTLRVYAEGTSRGGAPPLATIDIIDEAGKSVRSPSPSFVTGDSIKVQGVVPLDGLAPGAYVLRVTLSGAATRAIRESGFAIR